MVGTQETKVAPLYELSDEFDPPGHSLIPISPMVSVQSVSSVALGERTYRGVWDMGTLECPDPKRVDYFEVGTGRWIPEDRLDDWLAPTRRQVQRCEKKTCFVCNILLAKEYSKVILQAQPSHALGISNLCPVEGDWSVIEPKMKCFISEVRKVDQSFAYIYAVELNPDRTNVHCHGYFHAQGGGKRITIKVIDTARREAGLGIFKRTKLRMDDLNRRYTAYPFKTLADPDLVEDFHRLNGREGRRSLVHATNNRGNGRSFYRAGQGGDPIDQKTAMSIMKRRQWAERNREVIPLEDIQRQILAAA